MTAKALWHRLRLLTGVAGTCALIACGANGTVAGIEGTGITSSGAISGFGSVFVNGVEFATTSAAITVNGQAATQADLRSGQIVAIGGQIAPGGTSGTAGKVQYFANVRGPIGAANQANSTVTVLGQTVTVGSTTSLGADAGGTPTFASLTPGTLVEVSGFSGAGGAILAARIDIKTRIASDLLTGTAAAVDTAAQQFTVGGGVVVNDGAATFSGFPGGRALQAGDTVQVASAAGAVGGAIQATSVTYVGSLAGAAGSQGEIDGLVTNFVSATNFEVAGVQVTTNAATSYFNGAAGTLAAGVHVRVQGSFDAGGTLVAAKLSFDQSSPVLVQATVGAIDAAANTVQLLGLTVTTSVETRFDDQSPNPANPFNLSSLRVGDTVEVRGQTNAAAGIDASVLTRIAATATVELRGIASVAVAPNLTVLGVNAVTSATTRYVGTDGGALTGPQFFAAAPGAIVDLIGTLSGATLQVTTASLPGHAQTEE
jgi:hypothetical protein